MQISYFIFCFLLIAVLHNVRVSKFTFREFVLKILIIFNLKASDDEFTNSLNEISNKESQAGSDENE